MIFEPGTILKISYPSSQTTYFVTVTASTNSSVTFNKPVWSLPSIGTYVESGSTVYPQTSVSPNGEANGLARENLFYFNIAAGIKSDRYQLPNVFGSPTQIFDTPKSNNLSKQFEKIKGDSNILSTNRLSKYAVDTTTNPGDFYVQITSQSPLNAAYTTLSWYINDDDLLVAVPTARASVKTFYFTTQQSVPFDIGSTIKFTSYDNGAPSTYFAIVLAASQTSVSIDYPAWSVNSFTTYIESASTVYSQASVTIGGSIGTPRLNFFYFNQAPGKLADHWQNGSALNSQIQIFDTPKVSKLQDSFVIKESVSSELLNYKLTIDRTKVPSTGLELFFFPSSNGAITLQNLIRGYKTGNDLTYSDVNKIKLNSGTVELFYNPSAGLVTTFRTGGSKRGETGISDPSYKKKDPIQFWN